MEIVQLTNELRNMGILETMLLLTKLIGALFFIGFAYTIFKKIFKTGEKLGTWFIKKIS